uniref:Uncharacterized protein n=1 Tax=Lepeophtheirus salmonis TaxID=72036 RepID=A0A0K2VI75_LEPSM
MMSIVPLAVSSESIFVLLFSNVMSWINLEATLKFSSEENILLNIKDDLEFN